MGISCGYPDGNILQSGIRLVTCRTQRQCGAECGKDIVPSELMYHVSFYDYDECKTSTPLFVCEECGDLAENLTEQGYCYQWIGIQDQWRDYIAQAGKMVREEG